MQGSENGEQFTIILAGRLILHSVYFIGGRGISGMRMSIGYLEPLVADNTNT